MLFAVGLGLRLVLARGGGFPFDMSSFAGWAERLASTGPWDFYPPTGDDFFVDYPPGYLYVLWGLGAVARAAGRGAPPVFWIKMPPIVADLALAWLVGQLASRLAPAGRRLPVRGIAAAAILLNPAVFFVSAVWGQADSVLAVLVVGAFLCIGTGRPSLRREGAGMALLAAAVATKPQALFVLPVVLLVLVWRHVRGAETGGAFGSLTRAGGRLAAIALIGAGAGLAVLAPFRMWPADALDFYSRAADTYPYTSVFAFNLWGTVAFWRADLGPQALETGGVPVLYVGLALFAAAALVVLARAWRALSDGQHEGRVLVFGGVAITLVAFAALTRIHERYLFLAVALLASLVAFRWLRWALAALSVLYLVNVFFPYVYYLDYVGRPAPKLGGAFDAFYGTDIGGLRLKILSGVIAFACLVVAWFGWRRLEVSGVVEGARPGPAPTVATPPVAAEPPPSQAWTLPLHPVGRRGALIALAVFAVAFVSRVAGLGHPPGMYFDEVYHARTGAEYLNRKEVYEWTHPPLGKELIALSIRGLSGFEAGRASRLPPSVEPTRIGSGTSGVAWAAPKGSLAEVYRGDITGSCSLRAVGPPVVVDVQPDAVATSGEHVFVSGLGFEGPVLVRIEGSREVWRAVLPDRARAVVGLGDAAYVMTRDGSLVFVSGRGEPDGVAAGAAALTASSRSGVVWASFPTRGQIASWDRNGERSEVVAVGGRPGALAAPDGADRVLVADREAARIEVVDTGADRVSTQIDGSAALLASVPETGLVWAVQGSGVRIIEPRGASVIGRATLPLPARTLLTDVREHRLVAAGDDDLVCVGGRPTFAWRFGSAVAGSALVAFVFLLALRLFGSVWAAGLAALFVTVEGLAFTISRISMIDSYGVAFVVGAWFCASSALHRWGGDPVAKRSRPAALAWLVGAGIFGGLAIATKWTGVYALGGIGLVLIWDGFSRRRDSIWRVAGGFAPSAAVVIVTLGILPIALYVLSYIPYFSLGHSFADLMRLQRSMYAYHANLTATHPFGSPWYGWPFGFRAVFLYLADHGANRSEIWAAPNIVVLWGGLLAMIAAAVRSIRTRSMALGVVVLAALVQYLPWTIVSRVTFLYHYLPVVPFLAIALAWWLVEGQRERPYRHAVTAGVTVASVLFFLALLPVYEGWSVPVRYLQAVRDVLAWVLP